MPAAVSHFRTPSYCCHKGSGQAVVTLNGRDAYLGKYGTKASRAEYDRLIAEWLANGRCLPDAAADRDVNEVIHEFWQHAQSYYRRPDDSVSVELV
jgi:hypothetical protein